MDSELRKPVRRKGIYRDSYDRAHDQLRRMRGRAATYECVDCGQGADQWSYGGGNHTIGNYTHRRRTYYVKHITSCDTQDSRGCERLPGNAKRY